MQYDCTSIGLGAIIRDSNGFLKAVSSKICEHNLIKIPVAEVLAILEGLRFPTSLSIASLIVESDCLQATNLIDDVDSEISFNFYPCFI